MDKKPLAVGDIVSDRYRITTTLGQGGFATTFAAHDLERNQLVALKVLSLEHVGDWKSVELFRREAAALRNLEHPQIPDYIDFVDIEAEEVGFIVQQLAPGSPVSELLDEGRSFEPAECLDIARQVLKVLDYLASRNPPIIHRDIKPANLILDDDGTVYLVDFGAVRALATDTVGGSTMVGTLGYMAPEQLQGSATPASDLYALGMTLVHLVTGVRPDSLPKRRLKPDFRRAANLAPALELVLDQMLEPVPEDRLQSAAEALKLLGDSRIVPIPDHPSGDPIDRLVTARARELAKRQREQQAERARHRAAIARRRSRHEKATQLTTVDGNIELSYRPSLRQRLRGWRIQAIVGSSLGAVLCFGACVLTIVAGLHIAVIVNVCVWLGLFGVAALARLYTAVKVVRSEPIAVRVNPQGNFMVFRRESRPLAFGHLDELSVHARAASHDEEFGDASISAGTFSHKLERPTADDVATFLQFREVAGLD